jgi:S-adenosylmethionine hydrolase
VAASYSEGQPDRLHALINSNGQLEVFLKECSAHSRLRLKIGAFIYLS